MLRRLNLEGDGQADLWGHGGAFRAVYAYSIVLEPGAVAGYHGHARRPVVAYLVDGEYTEHRDGLPEIVHKPGEQWVEGADVAHWSENRGTETAVLINVEVFRAR